MLTSLIQKSEDNSRTGFELAKQQLKLHIAHLKLKQFFNSQNIILGSIVDMAHEPLVTHECDDISTSPQGPREDFTSDATHSCIDDDTMESVDPDLTSTLSVYQPGGVHETQTKASEDKELDALTSSVANTTSGFISMGIQNESYIMPCTDNVLHIDNVPRNDNSHHSDDVLTIQPEGHNVTSSTDKHVSIHEVKSLECTQAHAKSVSDGVNFVAGNDNDQIYSSDAMQPPTTAKTGKEHLTATHNHPLYMYINDILTDNISLPAHHLLNSLVITGPIPLPLFYVEELNNVVMNAVSSKRTQAESPMNELVKLGVVRSSSYPIIYHKDLHPDYIDTAIQLMFIPKLIYETVNDQMDHADKAVSILSVQRTLERLLTNETKPNLIQLHYILILCNQLDEVCSHVSDHLYTNLKLKLQILQILAKAATI